MSMTPQQIQAAMQTAAAHMQAKRMAGVEQAVAPILDAVPNHPDANFFMAIACMEQNRVEEAVLHARTAAAAAPGNPNILGTLGTILARAKRLDEAADAFKQLTEAAPTKPQGWFALGGLLTQLGRHDEAVAAFERIEQLSPGQPHTTLNLANALYEAQRYDEAASTIKRITLQAGADPNVQYTLGKALLASGDAEGALRAFDHLKGGMFELKSLAYREVALRELGRTAEADAVGRLETYVFPMQLEPPRGFTTIEEFNAALCQEIIDDPRMEEAPSHRATRNGTKVSNLLVNPSPLMQQFRTMLEGGIAEMQSHLREDAADGLFPVAPPESKYGIELWANIMHKQGHQLPHFHPEGWLSGCYYARLPQAVETSGEAHEGWIEFGRPAYHLPHTKEPTTRLVKPQEGMLVLFPSYLFHHTVPFESDEQRISIAFDVIPQSWQSRYRQKAMDGEVG